MYTFYQDSGHGYLRVPLSDLGKYKVSSKISEYSYQSPSNKYVYLEEDCDMPIFARAYKKIEKRPADADRKYIDGQAHFRKYPRYKNMKVLDAEDYLEASDSLEDSLDYLLSQ